MKKTLLWLSLSVFAAGAWAQNAPTSGISESTDPAKVQEVEKRAEDIKSRQQQASSGASDSASGKASSGKKHAKHRKSGAKAKSDSGSEQK